MYSFIFPILAFAIADDSPPMPLNGKVVTIADGDTVTVLVGKTQHRIRLEGIDTPERRQAFGTKARQSLANKVGGKVVRVEWKGRDRYKRILGHLYLGKRWINYELVADGMAWHYKRYNKDKRLADAETAARKAKKGLWLDPKPIPPWEYRRMKR